MIRIGQVVLSASNLNRYHYTALALQEAGLLNYYLCTFSGREAEGFFSKLLPKGKRQRLYGKKQAELDINIVKTFPLPYLITQSLHRVGLLGKAKTNEIFASWYDELTIPYASRGDIFHFVNGIGLHAARKAASTGTKLICDVRAVHVLEERELLQEEYSQLGLTYDPIRTHKTEQRCLAEYDLADFLIVQSDHTRETFIRRGFPSTKIKVLPLGVNLKRFSPLEATVQREQRTPFRVIFVGQIAPHKGLHYLLKAFQKVNLPDSELLIIGRVLDRGYMDRHVATADSRIRFLGHLPQIELKQFYQRSDVFVLPSISDGFAMVVSEAMAAGLPVIVSENVGSKDLIQDNIEGFIIPNRSVDTLAEKLIWLYKNPQERQIMGSQAQIRVQQFSWQQYQQNLLVIYEELALAWANKEDK
jgi:glycosyltransferase involved in cell wall biosynthesis